jgi:hypothetical protein
MKKILTLSASLILSACSDGVDEEPIVETPTNDTTVAVIDTESTVNIGDTFVLDASNSSSGNDEGLTYEWTGDIVGTIIEGDLNSQSFTFRASQVGDYNLSLVVTDSNSNTSTTDFIITVEHYSKITAPSGYSFGNLAINPSNYNEVIANLLPENAGSDSVTSVTMDAGSTWENISEVTGSSYYYAKSSPEHVYAIGQVGSSSEDVATISISSDSGLTWSHTRILDTIFGNSITAKSLTVDPSDESELWLTSSDVFTENAYKSTDGGETWSVADVGQVDIKANSGTYFYPGAFYHSNSNADVLYYTEGARENEEEYTIQKSTDNGLTWSPVATNLPISSLSIFEQPLMVSEVNSSHIVTSGYESKNGGETWQSSDLEPDSTIILSEGTYKYSTTFGLGHVDDKTVEFKSDGDFEVVYTARFDKLISYDSEFLYFVYENSILKLPRL